MSSFLEIYEQQYLEMPKMEQVGDTRSMFKVTRQLAPRWTEAAETTYRYVRFLDDLVDESPYISPVKELLAKEKQGLQDPADFTELQQRCLSGVMKNYFKDNGKAVRQNLYRVLQGLSLDLQLRDTQRPFTTRQLIPRNFLDLWPNFAIFSIGTIGVEPKPTVNTVNLMDAFATYDNIRDIQEDLSHGLNLIPKEDSDKYNLQFIPEQPLPIDQLVRYYRQKGKLVSPLLKKYASAFFETGMPCWLAALSYCYFYSKSLKLLKPLQVHPGLTYQIPKDAQAVAA
jgi:hypothetical protein